METTSETLWEIVEILLRSGNEPLARTAFRWSSEYAFLCGLKNSPTPVVITKFEQNFRPLRFNLDARLHRSWEAVLALWHREDLRAAKGHFVNALDRYYVYAVEISKYGARDCKDGVWSVNKWH